MDGLRGIAIIMVLIGHGAESLPPSPLFTYAGNGPLGVGIFFVLSGFLIFNLSVREVQQTGRFNWKLFYMRRVLRIFPAFYFYLVVVLLLTLAGAVKLSLPILFSAATFSLNYRHLWDHFSSGTSDYFVVGHYWTLALEEQFYLTWPVLMLLFARKKLLNVLLIIMLLAPILRVATYFLMPGSRGQIGMMFHTAFDSIAAGVLLGELLRRTRPRMWLERLTSNPLVLSCAVIFPVFLSPWLNEKVRGFDVVIGKSLILGSLCIVITAAVSFPQTLLFRFLNWRPLAYIGVLSYSLYVWNNFFLLGEKHWFNAFPANYACVFCMGLLSHYLVERPFLKLKRNFERKDAALPAAPPETLLKDAQSKTLDSPCERQP